MEELVDGMPEAQPPESRALTEKTARSLHAGIRKGNLPVLTVPAPCQLFAPGEAGAEDFYRSGDSYTILDLHRLARYLPKGKLPCPACGSSDRVESRGPMFNAIRKCADLGGNHYVTSFSYRCVGCPGALAPPPAADGGQSAVQPALPALPPAAAKGKSMASSHSPRLHQLGLGTGLPSHLDFARAATPSPPQPAVREHASEQLWR